MSTFLQNRNSLTPPWRLHLPAVLMATLITALALGHLT